MKTDIFLNNKLFFLSFLALNSCSPLWAHVSTGVSDEYDELHMCNIIRHRRCNEVIRTLIDLFASRGEIRCQALVNFTDSFCPISDEDGNHGSKSFNVELDVYGESVSRSKSYSLISSNCLESVRRHAAVDRLLSSFEQTA